MHHGDWNDGWGGGGHGGMILVAALLMIAFWAGLVWVAATFLRRDRHPLPQPRADGPVSVSAPARQTPEEILGERLARGEIEPDDYRQRLDALKQARPQG